MNCAVHTEVAAAGYCRNCGKALCEECKRDVRGVTYCEACLATLVNAPAAAVAATPPGAPNPTVAGLIGMVPTLGAVYNGEYVKAFVHFAIFAGIIAILNGDADGWEPLFGMALAAFIIYMPIEAYKTAKARLLGLPRTGPLDNLSDNPHAGAYVLIGIGAMILMSNFGLLRIGQVLRFGFPAALILAGFWMLRRRMNAAGPEGK